MQGTGGVLADRLRIELIDRATDCRNFAEWKKAVILAVLKVRKDSPILESRCM